MVTRPAKKRWPRVRQWRLALAALGAAGLIAALLTSSLRAQAPVQTFEGTLNIVWGDPHPDFGSGGEIRYTLILPDGSILPLQLTGQEGTAGLYFGKRVVVSGRVVQN